MIRNSTHTYGAITKTFHWVTALLIITLFPLGAIANRLPYETSEQLAQKAWLFSLHKTLGVTLFAVAVLRILWTLTQKKPGLLNANKPLESWAAETVHWLLYGALVIVPLSGWIHHAATSGFAPIWPPISTYIGQSLPLIPKSETIAHLFAGIHWVSTKVLLLALLLHIAGAIKHHVIDKDLTLKRMLPGHTAPDILPTQTHSRTPLITAVVVYIAVIAAGVAMGVTGKDDNDATPKLAEVSSGWTVQSGTLNLTIKQLGSDVTGEFQDWTAAIEFTEQPDANDLHGDVEVTIAIGSLKLGSVSGQAMGADFFAVEAFPNAVFAAPITSTDGNYTADGTLTIKGNEVPVSLPFTLDIAGDTAVMQGQATINRTNFNIGETYPDESSLGFDVQIEVNLTAVRSDQP